MSKIQIMTGNQAAAIGASMCGIQVVAAYPITPQTSVSEMMSEYVESGKLKAEYVRVESEHSAMTVCIAASTTGARVFTATCANGLLYMHEQLHWAAGSRLPIVMCCVNRGVGAPWTIFNDQQDAFSQRDTGWIQLYCRNNQEIIDTVIQAYRIAESAYIPVMVCYDGFVLSHTLMPVEIPDAAAVKNFIPPYRPHAPLSPEDPRCFNPVVFPGRRYNAEGILCDGYMELRYKLQHALEQSRDKIIEASAAYAEIFGRNHGGMLWEYRTEDAELILTGMGSIASEAMEACDTLRNEGLKIGVVGIRAYRPFPKLEIREAFARTKALIVLQKCISYGYEGGLCSELKSALYGTGIAPAVYDVVLGLGGRDVKVGELIETARQAWADMKSGVKERPTLWLNCYTGEENSK
jgi:pyruvate/2-oxoacid:ferredoxin oxidoreductase alpha subunit